MTLPDCGQLLAAAQANDLPWLAWTFHFRCPPNLLDDQSGDMCGIGIPLRRQRRLGRAHPDPARDPLVEEL